MANSKLNSHIINKPFVLVIVNEKFRYHNRRNDALADKENIKKFCHEMNFTVNDISDIKLEDTSVLKFDHKGHLITDDLTAREMKNLFQTISTGDFSSYDAFICFISSYGEAGGISGVDGETIPVQFLVDHFQGSKNFRTLVNKPKLFFAQSSSRSTDHDHDDAVADNGNQFAIPTGADILVAYSTVDGYEHYSSDEKGSWFIIKLLKVFREHANSMSLTDMLAMVNHEISKMVSQQGKKQMPCFTSSLRKAVRFEIKSSEIQPSAEPSSALREVEAPPLMA